MTSDLKKEVYAAYAAQAECTGSILPFQAVSFAVDYLKAKGVLMVWDTDMDSAPRDGDYCILLVHSKSKHDYDITVYVVTHCWFSNNSWHTKENAHSIKGLYEVEGTPIGWMPMPRPTYLSQTPENQKQTDLIAERLQKDCRK